MKFEVYIKACREPRKLQLIVDNMDEVKKAMEMLETYYDHYSGYEVYYLKQETPVYCDISELKQKYKRLGE